MGEYSKSIVDTFKAEAVKTCGQAHAPRIDELKGEIEARTGWKTFLSRLKSLDPLGRKDLINKDTLRAMLRQEEREERLCVSKTLHESLSEEMRRK